MPPSPPSQLYHASIWAKYALGYDKLPLLFDIKGTGECRNISLCCDITWPARRVDLLETFFTRKSWLAPPPPNHPILSTD